MKLLPTISICTLFVVAEAKAQNFAGQVYQLAEEYSDSKCKTDPECDCCTSDLIFLTPKQFAYISRCLFSDSYYTGTYSVKSGKLILAFKPIIVDEITDEETMKIENKKRNQSVNPIEFSINHCGVDLLKLEYFNGNQYTYGSRFERNKEGEIFKELKQKDAWKILSSSK